MHRTLENYEDLWILKLQTLKPNGLNDKLNHPENVSLKALLCVMFFHLLVTC